MTLKIFKGLILFLATYFSCMDVAGQQTIAPFQTTYGQMGGIKLLCIAASANGSAYSCNTTPTYVPVTTGTTIELLPDVDSNAGGVTLSVNGSDPFDISTIGTASGPVTNPAAVAMKAGTPVFMTLQYAASGFFFYWTAPALGTPPGSGTQVSLNSGATQSALAVTGYMPQTCVDTSGSGTTQSCSTAVSFTPQVGNSIIYQASTENSTQTLTVNVNGFGEKNIAIPGDSTWTSASGGSGWTATLPYDWFPQTPVMLTYDGTNWDATGIGINPGGYTPGFEITTTTSGRVVQLTGGWANCNGTMVNVAASGLLTLSPDATNYIYLDPSSSCVIDFGTSGFGSGIPLYVVTTGLSSTNSIVDERTMFYAPTTTPPGGSTEQLQYNNGGAFAGASGGTTDGTHFAFGPSSVINDPQYSSPGILTIENASPDTSITGLSGINSNILWSPSGSVTEGAFAANTLNVTTDFDNALSIAVNPSSALSVAMSDTTTGSTAGAYMTAANYQTTVGNASGTEVDGIVGGVGVGTGTWTDITGVNWTVEFNGTTADYAAGSTFFGTVAGASSVGTVAGFAAGDFSIYDTATVPNVASAWLIANPIASPNVTNNIGLYIDGVFNGDWSGGANNYALLSTSTALSQLDGPIISENIMADGILTMSEGAAAIAANGGVGHFYCSDCDTPLTQGATCTNVGDHAGTWANEIRGALKCY